MDSPAGTGDEQRAARAVEHIFGPDDQDPRDPAAAIAFLSRGGADEVTGGLEEPLTADWLRLAGAQRGSSAQSIGLPGR